MTDDELKASYRKEIGKGMPNDEFIAFKKVCSRTGIELDRVKSFSEAQSILLDYMKYVGELMDAATSEAEANEIFKRAYRKRDREKEV